MSLKDWETNLLFNHEVVFLDKQLFQMLLWTVKVIFVTGSESTQKELFTILNSTSVIG